MAKVKRVFILAALLALLALFWFFIQPGRAPMMAKSTETPQKASASDQFADAQDKAATLTPKFTALNEPTPMHQSAILSGSVIPPDYGLGAMTIVRPELTPDELAAPMPFQVSLRMRKLEELRARIAKGEILSQAEMSEKYYPTMANFEQVAAWLGAKGLQVQPPDLTRLSISVVGTTAVVSSALQVEFVRVQGIDGNEYTSAISAPSVPANFAPFVVGINGLQPQLKAFVWHAQVVLPPAVNSLPSIGPQTIAQYYHASGLGLDGTGQTIAIIGTGNPTSSDLTSFWTNTGTTQQSYANVTVINPWGNTGNSTDNAEETQDVEWASGMAPGAKIRLYQSLEPSQFVPAILSDLASNPGLRQASFSEGNSDFSTSSLLESDSQYYAALAAAGITFFASSGDWGQYSPHTGNDLTGAVIAVSYPASDPCVTAVGGTTLQFQSASTTTQASPDLPTTEVGWGQSGGGASFNFPRPSWQTGTGLPAGAWRMVPDVSAVANTYTGNNPTSRNLYLYYGGAGGAGGTSVSSPIWAGLCALINQSRANNGLPVVGLLGPKIYPLIGTSAFQDIFTTDSLLSTYIGATQAGTGYDICTGIGTPNIANLITALATSPNPQAFAPEIITQSGNQNVVSGATVALSVSATTPTNAPILSYHWRVSNPASVWNSGIDDGN
ncbi:MAG: S53 family peptidase, partial [Opitutaceae bacterium]